MKRLLAALLISSTVFAGTNRHVSTSGSSSNSGTVGSPWSLAYALAGAGGAIQNGDTVYCNAGTYFNPRSGQTNGGPNDGYVAFDVTVSSGTSGHPVIFRSYLGQRVIWDAGNTIGSDCNRISGVSHVYFWGIEFMSSDPHRNAVTNTYGDWSFPDAHEVAMGVGTNFTGSSTDVKYINCIFHDMQEGMGDTDWAGSTDAEFYGCLSFNNGWTAPDRHHGHNVYIQNTTGSTRKITQCMIWGASENNVQAYGSNDNGQLVVRDMNFDSNIIFQTGSDGSNFLLGGGGVPANGNIVNNCSFYQSTTQAVINLGWVPYGGGISNLTWTNNYVGGRYIEFQSPFSTSSTSGNTTYYTDIAGSLPSGFGGTGSKPTTNVIKVYPNLYESGRAHIAIFNWQNASSVSVDLSSVFQNGDTYTIVDAQNPSAVWKTGTYGGPVSISMNGTTTAQPIGNGGQTRTHTPSEFGAFIVTGGSTAAPVPSAPTANAATNKTRSGFTANWSTSTNATGYRLDVSTGSGFSSYVSGYQDRDMVSATSATLTGLAASTNYYYRVRAYNAAGTSGNSSTITATTLAGSSYRSAVILVHSVGSVLWSRYPDYSNLPNATTLPAEVTAYNSRNGFSGANAVSMTKIFFPNVTQSENDWWKWRKIFKGDDAESSALTGYLATYPVVIVKTCYLATQYMNAIDSIAAYKTSYRALVTLMAAHTSNFFVLWTNYPAATDGHGTRDQYSNLFSKWAKDTLAAGLDSYGAFPTNIYVFDVFHKLASSTDGYCDPIYGSFDEGPGGDHPSNAACALLDPLIVSEAFNAAIAYDGGTAVPSSPTANAASNVGANSFTANWSSVGTATGYYLDVATDAGFSSYVTGYNPKNVGLVTSSSVTGLTAGTNYYYRVRAFNTAGSSANSGTINVQTSAPPPTPLAIAATSITPTSFAANWNGASGATGYKLDVSTSSGFGTFVTGYNNKDVASVVTLPVTGLSAVTTYCYRVRAYNAAGTSNSSNTITVVTTGAGPSSHTYFVDNILGSDANDGHSGPWKTIAKVHSSSFSPGDSILFVKGGTWREWFVPPSSGSNGNPVYIGSYGSGARPRILGSVDLSSTSSWVLDGGSIWKSTVTLPSQSDPGDGNDVANMIYNNEASCGSKKFVKTDMATQGSFYFNPSDNLVYVYSAGNPGSYYSHIEAVSAVNQGIIFMYAMHDLTFDGLDVAYAGCLAFDLRGDCERIIIQNCDMRWIGGQRFNPPARSGQAFQTWDGGTDITVRYCNIDNSYDAAVSPQGTGTGWTMKRQRYYYNVFTNCTGAFEIWSEDGSAVLDSIFFENNTCIGAGNGWGQLERSDISAHIRTYENDPGSTLTHIYIRNNIFDSVTAKNAWSGLVELSYNWTPTQVAGLTLDNNLYYQPTGQAIMWQNVGYTQAQFASYQSATGKDAHSIATNPLLNSDFTLQINSPCINAGKAIGYTRDFAGNALVGLPDIGAYEYQNQSFPPSPPTANSATGISSSGFTANWTLSAGATGYLLDVSTSSTFASFVTGYNAKNVGSVTSLAVSGLSASTVYYYRLTAFNAQGSSTYSNTISLTTNAATPSAPTATAASSVTSTSFAANWNAVGGATGYYLDVSASPSFNSFVGAFNNLYVSNVTTFPVTGLSPTTTYYYVVRTYAPGGTSGNSNTITVSTSGTVPAHPLATAASSITDSSFRANWSLSAGATGYKLDVSSSGSWASFLTGDSARDVGNITYFDVTGLSANTAYYYRVRAYNAIGRSDSSNVDTVTTLDAPAPNAPVADSATSVTTNSFAANWTASSGATGYRLDVSEDPAFASFVGAYSNLDVSNVTTYPVTGLKYSTVYYYRVRAYSTHGTSGNSNIMTPRTLDVTPSGTFKRSIILQKANP